jgi:hypothetical protein
MTTCLVFVLLLLTLARDPASAEILNVSGEVTGTINGTSIAGQCAGMIDTTGVQGASFTLPFTQWPASFDPSAVCYAMCPLGALKSIGNAKNIFDLTGGNFTYTYDFSYPDSIGSAVTVTGQVATAGNQMTYTLAINGNCDLPVQTGQYAGDVEEHWANAPNNGIVVQGSGKITIPKPSHSVYPVSWSLVFDPDPLPGDEISSLTFTTQTFNWETKVLEMAYLGDIRVVPEPPSLILLVAGSVVLLVYPWKRRVA